jgi:RNA polymerase sigma-70 factor (ECF subfamily)
VETVSPPDELELLRALRAGDERAFERLVDGYHASLLRLALSFVRSRAVAEEVVQETWLGVLSGLERFDGRCSLKTWIFKIAANIARTRGVRERRCLPFSSLGGGEDAGEPAAGPDRFHPNDHPCAGHWARPPRPWDTPEGALLSAETRDVVRVAIARLPPSQRLVVTLRDVEGWSAGETCEALEISAGNQRVLLHRGRCKVRAALERHLERVESAA